MRICPNCRRTFADDGTVRCSDDGARLLHLGTGDRRLGTLVGERYLVTDLLGQGGMGVVYRARQLNMHRDVAVKVLASDISARPASAQRFVREARVTAQLRSPHTVTVHDFGTLEDGSLWLAMELLGGLPLDELLRRHGALAPSRARRIATQVCLSLEEAHSQGVVHRDLKPGNIVLESAGTGADFAKVLDFGIVKILEEPEGEKITRTGMTVGTAAYMSPEQAEGVSIDATTDQYALGVTLFELLTGTLPFTGASSLEVLLGHLGKPPPKLASVSDDPAVVAFGPIIERCLEKQPGRRFADVRLLRMALEALDLPEAPHERPTDDYVEATSPATQQLDEEPRRFGGVDPTDIVLPSAAGRAGRAVVSAGGPVLDTAATLDHDLVAHTDTVDHSAVADTMASHLITLPPPNDGATVPQVASVQKEGAPPRTVVTPVATEITGTGMRAAAGTPPQVWIAVAVVVLGVGALAWFMMKGEPSHEGDGAAGTSGAKVAAVATGAGTPSAPAPTAAGAPAADSGSVGPSAIPPAPVAERSGKEPPSAPPPAAEVAKTGSTPSRGSAGVSKKARTPRKPAAKPRRCGVTVSSVNGQIDPAAALSALGSVKKKLASCCARHVPTGSVRARVMVRSDGATGRVEFKGDAAASKAVSSCVGGALSGVRFPAPGSFEVLTVKLAARK